MNHAQRVIRQGRLTEVQMFPTNPIASNRFNERYPRGLTDEMGFPTNPIASNRFNCGLMKALPDGYSRRQMRGLLLKLYFFS